MNDNLICDKDCIKDLRPYEKCISLGEQSLTDTELIAAIIKTGVSGKPAGELAKDILDKSHNKGLLGLFDMSIDELMDIKGIGLAKAAQLKCQEDLPSSQQGKDWIFHRHMLLLSIICRI